MTPDHRTPMTDTAPKPVTLFLMTEKGLAFLQGTVGRYKALFALVVVGRDSALQNDCAAEIIALCKAEGIPVVQKADFDIVTTDYAMAVAWRWLIPHPADRLIVFHDSVLPRYRGFAPLVTTLVKGETEIGVTALFGAGGYDRGAIIAQSACQIAYPITIAEAITINMANYLACAETVLGHLLAKRPLPATPQDEGRATYSVWRDESDYQIDWSRSAAEIRRLIDAVGAPYRGAATGFEGRLLRILAAEEVADVVVEDRHPGKVLFLDEGRPVVICGSGLLMLTRAEYDDKGADPFFPLNRFRLRFSNT